MCAHALTDFIFQHPTQINEWYYNSNYLALLSVKDENALINLIKQAEIKNIKHSIFKEPDINDEIGSIVLEPGDITKKLCSNLPLALKNK